MIGRRKQINKQTNKWSTINLIFQLQFSDAPFFFDRDESLPETKEASHFVVDLLAKLTHPSLPRADCSLWKHGAEHCRTVCLARVSARMQHTTAWLGGMCEKVCFFRMHFLGFLDFFPNFSPRESVFGEIRKSISKNTHRGREKKCPRYPFFSTAPPLG